MRADIHDGQERCSTKGRIHVRKTNLTISKASCDARPVHTWVKLSPSGRSTNVGSLRAA